MTSAPDVPVRLSRSGWGEAFRRLPLPAKFSLGVIAVLIAVFSAHLWPEWRHNPDLSHGFFMPVVFLILLHESRSATARRWLPAGRRSDAALGLLLVAGLLSLCAAGLYAAALDWSHAVVNFSLTAALVLLIGATIVALADDRLRFVPCNWSTGVAAGLWLLCTPIPPGAYTRLTLSLQLWVSENVLRALHLLGIAAERHGNIIELAHGSVGIEEACSGVRSLISCVFAGFFFSATLVRRPWARVLIIGLSVPLALGMNFLRSLTLTLLANSGTNIAGPWHDATGFAVLGVTAVVLGGVALALEHGEAKIEAPIEPSPAAPAPGNRQLRSLAGGLGLALLALAVFVGNTRTTPRQGVPVPNLRAALPALTAGWRVQNDDLYIFRDALRTDHLAQRTYLKHTDEGEIRVIIYLAYWPPGQASVSLVASHTPDACWPGSGWAAQPVAQPREKLKVGGRTLADAEYRMFKFGEDPEFVWFWHIYDGHPINYRDPYSATELLRIALRYGFRHDGDQMFIRVSSNRPWREIEHEPFIAEFFEHTRAFGL